MKHFPWHKPSAAVICVMAAMSLTSCSDNTTNYQSMPTDATNLNYFSDTPSVNERFGTATSRNLNPDANNSVDSVVVDSVNSFSLTLHKSIAANLPNENSIQSGYSAASVLALASAAAGGKTYQSLVELLGLSALAEDDIHQSMNWLSLSLLKRSTDDVALKVANRLFVEPNLDLVDEPLNIATESYGAPVTESDFLNDTSNVESVINDWVSDITNGFIPKIVEDIDPQS